MADQSKLEQELIDDLADTLCMAVEDLDAQTIIRCIKAAIGDLANGHQKQLTLLNQLDEAIRLP